jgi:hypothetical protein
MRAVGQRALGFHQIQLKHTNDLRCGTSAVDKTYPLPYSAKRKKKIEIKKREEAK